MEAGGSTHPPASGEAVPASLISWVTKVFTRPSPAATRLVGMRSPSPSRGVCPGRGFSPLVTGGRGASTSCPDSTALQGDDFVLCARHVPRHTKAVCGRCVRCVCGAPHTHTARCGSCKHVAMACACSYPVMMVWRGGYTWRSGCLSLRAAAISGRTLCARALSWGICCWPPPLDPVPAPGPTRCSHSAVKIDHVSQAHG